MANSTIHSVAIKGIAAAVPRNTVYNKDYELFSEQEYEKFVNSVGIEQRRVTPQGMCTSDLCFEAATKLLVDLGWSSMDVDALIFVSHTPDYKLPATSCTLQDRLQLSKDCMTLDISLGCSGFPHGLHTMSAILQNGHFKRGLLLVGNTQSHYSSFYDKSVYPLFADAGTAIAVEFDPTSEPMHFNFGTDGSGYESIMIEDGGCRNPVNKESFEYYDIGNGNKKTRLHEGLDGMDVYSFGIKIGPQSFRKLFEYSGFPEEKIDYFLFHQANKMMIEKIAKKLNLTENVVPMNLKYFGNTSCATIPLLMVTNLKDKLTSESLNLFFCGFGVGLSWGSAICSTRNIVCSDLIEVD